MIHHVITLLLLSGACVNAHVGTLAPYCQCMKHKPGTFFFGKQSGFFASDTKARLKTHPAALVSVQNSPAASLNVPFPTCDPIGVKTPDLLEGCSFSLCFIGNLQC